MVTASSVGAGEVVAARPPAPRTSARHGNTRTRTKPASTDASSPLPCSEWQSCSGCSQDAIIMTTERKTFNACGRGHGVEPIFSASKNVSAVLIHDGYVYVTSECSFGKDDAIVSLRRYGARNGARAGTWSAKKTTAFVGVRKPRGIAFADDDVLLICAQNCVPAVDVMTFGTARVVAEDNDLAGRSLALGAIVTFAPGRAA